MGTGSESRQMPNPRKNAAGSVPVPFFHAGYDGPPSPSKLCVLVNQGHEFHRWDRISTASESHRTNFKTRP